MKTYHVKFWYNTDLRADCKIMAMNEVRALTKALDDLNICEWANEKGFRVTIERV